MGRFSACIRRSSERRDAPPIGHRLDPWGCGTEFMGAWDFDPWSEGLEVADLQALDSQGIDSTRGGMWLQMPWRHDPAKISLQVAA